MGKHGFEFNTGLVWFFLHAGALLGIFLISVLDEGSRGKRLVTAMLLPYLGFLCVVEDPFFRPFLSVLVVWAVLVSSLPRVAQWPLVACVVGWVAVRSVWGTEYEQFLGLAMVYMDVLLILAFRTRYLAQVFLGLPILGFFTYYLLTGSGLSTLERTLGLASLSLPALYLYGWAVRPLLGQRVWRIPMEDAAESEESGGLTDC